MALQIVVISDPTSGTGNDVARCPDVPRDDVARIPHALELDGRTEQLEATMVAVGNEPCFGGGLDDGPLDVVVIAPPSVDVEPGAPRVPAGAGR